METNPASLTAGAPRVKLEFSYDYLGRRISKAVSKWSGSGYIPIQKFLFVTMAGIWRQRCSTVVRKSAAMFGKRSSGGQGAEVLVSSFHRQAQGSKAYATGYDGMEMLHGYIHGRFGPQVASYEYGPFGEVVRSSGLMAE